MQESCRADSKDCGSALRCDDDRCRPFATVGQSCTVPSDCVDGASCIEGLCAAASACGAGQRDDACMAFGQCAEGLVCHASQRRCVRAHELGEPCTLDVVCARGLVCRNVSINQDGVCERLQRLQDGAECELFVECKSGFCVEGRCKTVEACSER